ncbi:MULTISPECIES: ABC transporter substrate-binding protein [unclassified Parafrankia]|uniref:ABC transporter substrate-binding protein n=1 Tax=unclassified Parafrankia TaxID=2994368 RepID=UPI000DA589EB|nr:MULTISPECIES: ABC transporter substrate-binding protein [unclassified Parafrankia]TCJ31835.1 transporter substrate-binding domain-containing protein [Parafrankia sp. BMG5.11]SQE00639.1 putative alkanesulfonate transport protein (ABC superfamily) [Parafrankia sp. Ea1.12]
MHHRRTRGRRLALASAGLAALLTVGLAACGGGDSDPAAPASGGKAGTLRIGDQSKFLELPITLSGAGRDTPYKLNWNNFADGPHMNAAFSAGRLDVGFMGDTPVLFANAADAGVVAVAVAENRVNSQTIFASAGSGIHSLADLKGKRVAFTRGTSLHGYLLNQLDSVGLTQDDVTPVNVPAASLPATFSSGAVDAVVYVRQFGAAVTAQSAGSYEVETKPLPQYSVLLAAKDALADPARREAVRDFVLRLSRASAWPKQNPDEWIQKYYVETLKQDPVAARKYFESLPESRYTPVTAAFVDSQRTQAKLLADVGELPPSLNVDDEVDKAFTTELTAAFTAASLPT